MVGPGGALHQPVPQCKPAASTGAMSLPSVPSWRRAPVPQPCSGCPACQQAWGRWKQVRWGRVCASGSFKPTLLPDAALLADVTEDILCFSRSFEDLTCFWDEAETTTGIYYFYYWYNR